MHAPSFTFSLEEAADLAVKMLGVTDHLKVPPVPLADVLLPDESPYLAKELERKQEAKRGDRTSGQWQPLHRSQCMHVAKMLSNQS